MRPKHPSLQEHAKQSHSINVNEISYCDYIDQKVKQNQITPFQSFHSQTPSNSQKNSLKELNSNQQSQKIRNSVDKNHLESGEVKLYRERVQTLENRLKEKSAHLKLKEQEIQRLNVINEELEQFKMKVLLSDSSEMSSNHKISQQKSKVSEKQVQTDFFQQDSSTKNPISQLKFDEQTIQVHFQLQKYKKKYLIIEQNLKKRVTQYESQLTSLTKKLKQQKLKTASIQQQFFALQQENINLKQKLQQVYGEIESFEMQRDDLSQRNEISQEMSPVIFGINEKNGRRFSLGDDLNENYEGKKPGHVFLSIFNEVSYSFVPQINQKTGRFKDDFKKRNNYMIRIYPRLYELKIVGCQNSKRVPDENNLKDFGCNTIQRRLFMAASVNIKVPPSNAQKLKTKRTLRICSKQVTLAPSLLPKRQLSKQKIPHSFEPMLERNRMIPKNYELHSRRVQLHAKEENPIKINDIGFSRPENPTFIQDKDIIQRINYHLKNSHLASPKIQEKDDFKRDNLNSQFIKSRPKIDSISKSLNRKEPIKLKTENTYSDWIVDEVHEETNKILQKYAPVDVSEITYHQSYPRTYHTQDTENLIQRQRNFSMKRSSSIQNIQTSERPSLTLFDKTLTRNMSLSTFDHTKPRECLPKSDETRVKNSILMEAKPLQMNRTQDIATIPVTPSRQMGQKVNSSISMKDLIAQKCKKLSIN